MTMKRSTIVITASVLAIAVPSVYLVFNDQVPGRFAGADLSSELALVKSDIKALKQANIEVGKLTQRIAQLENQNGSHVVKAKGQSANESSSFDAYEMTQEEPKSPQEMAKEQESLKAKQLAQINTAFLAEPSDQKWATETTHLVTSFFDNEKAANLNVADIQCRKTLCKVELSKVDRAKAGNELALNFPIHVGQALANASYFYEDNADGSANVTIYLARNGYELPTEF
jgi:hypothetical protein